VPSIVLIYRPPNGDCCCSGDTDSVLGFNKPIIWDRHTWSQAYMEESSSTALYNIRQSDLSEPHDAWSLGQWICAYFLAGLFPMLRSIWWSERRCSDILDHSFKVMWNSVLYEFAFKDFVRGWDSVYDKLNCHKKTARRCVSLYDFLS